MKTKLKTLKDMRREVYGSNSGRVLDHVKQEAIKWVKEDRGVLHILPKADLLSRWMRRFNITEEDLK